MREYKLNGTALKSQASSAEWLKKALLALEVKRYCSNYLPLELFPYNVGIHTGPTCYGTYDRELWSS